MRTRALSLVVVLLSASFAGCLGFGAKEEAAAEDVNQAVRDLVGNRTQERIESVLSAVPKNYTFPGQLALPQQVIYINGSIDTSANTAFEDKNDRAGNSYGVVRQVADVSKVIPAGQPTELRLTLYYYNQAGNSAKCDILVDVPGHRTSFNPSNNDEMNWKFSVQRLVINTIGVPGQKHDVGVACANGRVTSNVPYTLRVDATYEKDVLAPGVPWAFKVPANASGVILESAKAGGPEHLKAWFVVVSPSDELVQFVDFNDIAIPTESVFIPTAEPGEYVFYAFNMTGGFLRLRADAPVEERSVRILAMNEQRVQDGQGPVPGLAERDWRHDGAVVTPAQGGQEATFTVEGAFPLRVEPFIGDASGAKTLMTDVRISSSKGLVSSLQRVLRVDDERGSLGLTQDEFNRQFLPWNLAKGTYTVQIVNNSPDAVVGHVVTTYVR